MASGTAYSRSTWQRLGAEVAWEQIKATGQIPMSTGVDGKVRPAVRYDTTERDAGIRRRRAEALSIRTIATEFGVSVGTVHRVLSRDVS